MLLLPQTLVESRAMSAASRRVRGGVKQVHRASPSTKNFAAMRGSVMSPITPGCRPPPPWRGRALRGGSPCSALRASRGVRSNCGGTPGRIGYQMRRAGWPLSLGYRGGDRPRALEHEPAGVRSVVRCQFWCPRRRSTQAEPCGAACARSSAPSPFGVTVGRPSGETKCVRAPTCADWMARATTTPMALKSP